MGGQRFLRGAALAGALLACQSSAADSWEQFLRKPDATSFDALARGLDGDQCDWGDPVNKEMVPDSVRGRLFELISSGNEYAFVVALSTIKCFDGADLEDLFRSSGRFLERRPRRFLAAVAEKGISSSNVASMAASVPTDDDIDGALVKVANRIALLREIDDENLRQVQAESLRALERREQNLRNVKASRDNRQ